MARSTHSDELSKKKCECEAKAWVLWLWLYVASCTIIDKLFACLNEEREIHMSVIASRDAKETASKRWPLLESDTLVTAHWWGRKTQKSTLEIPARSWQERLSRLPKWHSECNWATHTTGSDIDTLHPGDCHWSQHWSGSRACHTLDPTAQALRLCWPHP